MSNFIKRVLSSIVFLTIALYFILQGSYAFLFFLTVCLLISCFEWHNMTKDYLHKICGFLFLIVSFYFFYKISVETINLFFVIILCISTDIGGYVFGKIFKGPKLTKISPNKTYSGMIGGYTLSLISLIIFSKYFFALTLTNTQLIIICFFLSSVSQIGDIIVSFFKRQAKIKNTGNLIPGHGGLLDRIDGMIFVFPIFYLLSLFEVFNL